MLGRFRGVGQIGLPLNHVAEHNEARPRTDYRTCIKNADDDRYFIRKIQISFIRKSNFLEYRSSSRCRHAPSSTLCPKQHQKSLKSLNF